MHEIAPFMSNCTHLYTHSNIYECVHIYRYIHCIYIYIYIYMYIQPYEYTHQKKHVCVNVYVPPPYICSQNRAIDIHEHTYVYAYLFQCVCAHIDELNIFFLCVYISKCPLIWLHIFVCVYKNIRVGGRDIYVYTHTNIFLHMRRQVDIHTHKYMCVVGRAIVHAHN